MPWTNAWNEATPAGTDLASTIDDSMRQIKLDVRERLNSQHVWGVNTTDDGGHRNIAIGASYCAANVAGLAIAGFSLTAANAQSLVDLAGTWNTSGTPVGIKLNIVNTASNQNSKLMDLQASGVSKFSVDPNGVVNAPKQLGCRVYNSTLQSVLTGVETTRTFDSEDFDNGAIHSTAVNTNRITIPSGGEGLWLFVASQVFASNPAGARYVYLVKNGITPIGGQIQDAASFTQVMQASAIVVVSAGDYVEVHVAQSSGGSLNVGSITNDYDFFSAIKLG